MCGYLHASYKINDTAVHGWLSDGRIFAENSRWTPVEPGKNSDWRQHTTVTPASGTSLLHAKKAAYNWSAACKARAQRKRGPVGWRTSQKIGCRGQRGRRQRRGRLRAQIFEPLTGDLQGGILFFVSPHCLLQGFRKVSLVSTLFRSSPSTFGIGFNDAKMGQNLVQALRAFQPSSPALDPGPSAKRRSR